MFTGGETVIARFGTDLSNPDLADPASETEILGFDQPHTNHNGGDLMFGPDGYLYIGTGDGGSGGDPDDNGQDLSVLLGKILRIDVDGGSPYAIPENNPFVDDTMARQEIWALGLRNPWRFSFDRETGDLWIADVGQQNFEEIDFQPASDTGGANYGWRCYEGNSVYNSQDCPAESNFTFPVHEYSHDPDDHCSVTGGFVYRGKRFPALEGYYFFADYCSNTLWSLHDSSGNLVLRDHGVYAGNAFSTFGEDGDGELYLAGLSSGKIYRIVDTGTVRSGVETHRTGFRVYPNPAVDRIRIETGGMIQVPLRVRILDLSGAVLYSSQITGEPLRIGLDFLEPGIYFLEIRNGNIREMRKLIKL